MLMLWEIVMLHVCIVMFEVLSKKFSKFFDMLHEISLIFEFLVLTETWCSRDCAGLFPLAGYSQFDFTRLSKSKKTRGWHLHLCS